MDKHQARVIIRGWLLINLGDSTVTIDNVVENFTIKLDHYLANFTDTATEVINCQFKSEFNRAKPERVRDFLNLLINLRPVYRNSLLSCLIDNALLLPDLELARDLLSEYLAVNGRDINYLTGLLTLIMTDYAEEHAEQIKDLIKEIESYEL